MSLTSILAARAARHPDAPALEGGGVTLSYARLLALVDDLAARLAARGVGPGGRVAVLTGRDMLEPALIFAVWKRRAAVTVVNRLWKPAQVAHGLAVLDPTLFVAERAAAGRLAAGDGFVPPRCGVLALEDLMDTPPQADDPGPAQPDDVALVLFTSGSTGRPKGVVHDMRALRTWTEATNRYLAHRRGDRVLAVLPLAFGYGLNQLLAMVACGGCYRIARSLLVPDILRELSEAPVTMLPGVPGFWRDVARMAPSVGLDSGRLALRLVTNAGGHCPPAVMDAVRRAVGGPDPVLMYGMTETLRSTWLPPSLYARKPGAIGQAVPGAVIALADAHGKPCRPGEVGEIVHAGPTVARGYLGEPDRDGERFRPAPDWMELRPGTRACFTGDLARMDEDGVLWFHARSDRQIKIRGFRIGPAEIEDAARGFPGVEDAVALGMSESGGDTVLHLAVVAPGVAEGDLAVFLKKRLATYMVPSRIHLWQAAFPLTANGKTDIEAIRRAVAGA